MTKGKKEQDSSRQPYVTVIRKQKEDVNFETQNSFSNKKKYL